MKKRIVSLLLLAAMLITAIPVMTAAVAAAEEPQAEEEQVAYIDPHTLYVRDGLQTLFTVFGDKSGVDLDAGTWTARVGKAVATFGNKDQWEKNSIGAVGFEMYWGTVIDGKYETSYVYETDPETGEIILYKTVDNKTVVSTDGTGNPKVIGYKNTNWDLNGTRLNLGISLLPADDFTVEYFAQYKPYYVTDGEGNLVPDANGDPTETYNASGKVMPQADPGGNINRSVIRMGYLQAFTYNYDGAWGNGGGSRGNGTRWTVSGTNNWGASNELAFDPFVGSVAFVANETVRTYAISRTEYDDNQYSVSYDWYKDAAKTYTTDKATGPVDTSAVNGQRYIKADFDVAEKDLTGSGDPNYFWLSERHGTDFYSVRIYDRVLTEEERTRNRVVDVMLYYDLKLPLDYAHDAILARVTDLLKGETCDAEGYAEKQASLQTTIDQYVAHARVADMYAQREHITAFFSALDADTISLSGGKGTWQSLVGPETASFNVYASATNAKWVYSNKSVGITHFYGQLGADKTTLTTSASTNTVGNGNYLNSRLQLGLSLLPKEDFTIDYVAQYNPIYVANTAGGIATFTEEYVTAKSLDSSLVGAPMEYFLATGNGVGNAQYWGNYDFIGFIASRPVYLDGVYSSHHKRGNVCWILSDNKHTWDASCDWVGAGAFNGGLRGSGDIREVGVTHNYAIMRDETLTVAEDSTRTVTAVYSLWKDGVIPHVNYKSPTLSTANTAAGMYYWDKDDTGNFYLSAMTSTDFYSLRIYDIVLTAEEMNHNRTIDLLRYFEIDTSAIGEDEALREELYAKLLQKNFVEDPLEWTDIHEELQGFIDHRIEEKKNQAQYATYASRYAESDHLKSLFTAFAPGTIDITAGTWTDLVSGAEATFGNASFWKVNAQSGAVGFNTFYGTLTDGVFTGSTSLGSSVNTAANYGTRLNLGIALLPQEDFTVEYTAMYKPVYVYDANEADQIAKDGTTKLEAYTYSQTDYGSTYDNTSIDNLGWFQSITTGLDTNANYDNFVYGTAYASEEKWGLTRGSIHWVFGQQNGDNSGWYDTGAQAFWMGADRKVTSGLNKVGDPFQTNDEIRTYGIVVDETVTVEGYTEAMFSLYRDNTCYNSNRDVDELNTSKKGFADGGYYDATTEYDSKCRFWLSATRPTDFFAVRVYDTVLTNAEMAHNRFVDLLFYYGIELDEEVWANGKTLAKLVNAFADESFVLDTAEKAEKKIVLEDAITALLNEKTADNDYAALYVTEGIVGLFTDFSADDGVDLANGIWKNAVKGYGDATFRGNVWEDREKGVGYTMLYTDWQTAATHKSVGLSLPAAYEDLDAYTMEAFATMVGPTDETGARWCVTGQKFVSYSSSFRFGMLSSLFFGNVTPTGGSLSLRWCLWQSGWRGSAPSAYGNVGNWFYDDAGWRAMGDFMTPTAGVMQVTMKETLTDGVLTDVTYNIAYNNAKGSTIGVTEGNYKFTMENYNIWANAYTRAQSLSSDAAGRFSLFNAMPATVYAVRVYDRLLTEAEEKQNRLADLLYYHDVNIKGEAIDYLLANPEVLAAAAEVAAGIKISEVESEKQANKTKLEAALAPKQVNVQMSDGSSDTMHFVGDQLVLPEQANNKQIAAWVVTDTNTTHIPGSSVDVENGASLRAVVVDAPSTNSSVSLKMTAAEKDIAMRFTATLSRTDFEAIAAAYGKEKLTVGMLVTPATYVEMAGGVFTREALRAMVDAKTGDEAAPAYIDIPSYGGFYTTDENTMTIAGSIYNFSPITRQKNPAFAAVAFIDIDIDGDLVTDFTVYGAYNPNANHKVMDSFAKARPYVTDLQKTWIDALLKSFGA